MDRQRVREIFLQALERSDDGERHRFVAEACAGDEAVLREVRSLLAAAERRPTFLEAPTLEPGPAAARSAEKLGSRLGPYRLLELIGEGGFGAVYMAEQSEPVRRLVALKIIKLGMDTQAVIARFEAERQALALMEHAHIAKVFDAGATETGRPYFVMELVKGEPITKYCDRERLTIRERIELFSQVCNAVQHAHAKGVIHRDIKPGNVLVATQDGRAHAKVIDFGIAKATQARLTERTLYTEFRQFIGTPEYMSPEQAAGSLDVDTRSDVYSLGVLLYELLTGTTPFDAAALRSAAYGEIERIIREVEPPKPSTRLSTSAALWQVAQKRNAPPARLSAMVRGELDWIAMRALEKDRGRRYETPAALGEDLARFLAGEAVRAAPPSPLYRASRFARRHRTLVLAGLLLTLSLVLGLIGTTFGLLRAERALWRAVEAERAAIQQRDQAERAEQSATRARAEAELARAQAERAQAQAEQDRDRAEQSNRIASAVTEFFTQDVLNAMPTGEGQAEVTLRQMLDAVPRIIDEHFDADPAIEGAIRERVGLLYRRLGEQAKAESYLRDAVPLLEKGLGPDSKGALSAVHRLGEWMMDRQNYADAIPLFERAYQGRLAAHGITYAFTLNSLARLGAAKVGAGRTQEGLADLRAAVAGTVQQHGTKSKATLVLERRLAKELLIAGIPDEALAMLTRHMQLIKEDPEQLGMMEGVTSLLLGEAHLGLGDAKEALVWLDAAMDLGLKTHPAEHGIFIEIRPKRAAALAMLGRAEEAVAECEQALAIARRTYGKDSPWCRDIVRQLSEYASAAGDTDGAERWREEFERLDALLR
ncbi:MAG: serine/threonine-protein kinase [Planctomycetota bacterium]|nr:serine/threonine-protein kinase [Planctomycetota bacterium]